MFERKERGGGFNWVMDGPHGWCGNLDEIKEMPVAVVETPEGDQSTFHPDVFDRLLRENIN